MKMTYLSKVSARGVYYDLTESPYIVKVESVAGTTDFRFSSLARMNQFIRKCQKNKDEINKLLNKLKLLTALPDDVNYLFSDLNISIKVYAQVQADGQTP